MYLVVAHGCVCGKACVHGFVTSVTCNKPNITAPYANSNVPELWELCLDGISITYLRHPCDTPGRACVEVTKRYLTWVTHLATLSYN